MATIIAWDEPVDGAWTPEGREMSETYQLERSIERWAALSPKAVASGSDAQAMFCIGDAQKDIATLAAAMREGLGILTNLHDSIAKHGNYSAESTMGFIDQAGACLREALKAREPRP